MYQHNLKFPIRFEDEEEDPFTAVVGLGSVATARIRRERLRRGMLETKERREEKENRVGWGPQ